MSNVSIRKLDPEYHGCKRKFPYPSWEEAVEAAKRRTAAAGHEIHAYLCKFCGEPHIGRKQPC